MVYAKTQKQAIYRIGLKHSLRKKGIRGWRKDSPTKKLEKLLKVRRVRKVRRVKKKK